MKAISRMGVRLRRLTPFKRDISTVSGWYAFESLGWISSGKLQSTNVIKSHLFQISHISL